VDLILGKEWAVTEEEWMASTNSSKMLVFLHEKVSNRKLRLFICACCRSSWHLLADKRSRQAVVMSESFADGVASKKNLDTALANAKAALRTLRTRMAEIANRPGVSPKDEELQLAWNSLGVVGAAQLAVEGDAWRSALHVAENGETSERTGSYSFLHEIFGNPFRPIAFEANWLTSTVVALATAIYRDRAFDRMPILADALQDAGCENEDILNHCRGAGNHVRGCWVVDLLLRKEWAMTEEEWLAATDPTPMREFLRGNLWVVMKRKWRHGAAIMNLELVLKELAELLYGLNYAVFLRLYRMPFSGAGLEEYVAQALGPTAVVGGSLPVTGQELLAEIEKSLRYAGDSGSGPHQSALHSKKFEELLGKIFSYFEYVVSGANLVEQFWLKEGHPDYPVFWDFAYIIAGTHEAVVFIGSSSDWDIIGMSFATMRKSLSNFGMVVRTFEDVG
jgi:hypothetical protein